MNYVTLQGAEQVASASRRMEEAALSMARSAQQFEDALRRHQEFLADWLARMEQLAAPKADLVGRDLMGNPFPQVHVTCCGNYDPASHQGHRCTGCPHLVWPTDFVARGA
jgi:hypothetical protein